MKSANDVILITLSVFNKKVFTFQILHYFILKFTYEICATLTF